jgi:hypothetical protein
MKTLKEKWTEALPVFASILCLLGIIFLIIWGFSKLLPTNEELRQRKEEKVRDIKLCIDNNLEAYQSETGDWYCKPRE